MDYYSSTKAAMRIFDADDKYLLPRIWNYFDDIGGDNLALLSDYTGERLAIKEFNDSHPDKKNIPRIQSSGTDAYKVLASSGFCTAYF
jgi:hypothetical protein